jgi:predicted ATP-dependent serine protease
MRATATWDSHHAGAHIIIAGEKGSGKSTALKALVSRFEKCLSSSAWGSEALWKLLPHSPATAPHVRLRKPVDTMMWYPTSRISSCPEDTPLSKWYIGSVLEELAEARNCVIVIDDIDLFDDADTVAGTVSAACDVSGCQLVAAVRGKITPKSNLVVIPVS